MSGVGGCGQAYSSHDWSTDRPRACRACGAIDLGDARAFRAVLDQLAEAGYQVYDDRSPPDGG